MNTIHLDVAPRLLAPLFGEAWQARLEALGYRPNAAADATVLVTAWGSLPLDAERLNQFPKLELVAHAAGTVKALVSDALFARGIRITSAAAANAIPVAEYTTAMIVLAGKNAFGFAAEYRRSRKFPAIHAVPAGNRGVSVGVISASLVGRLVLERLRSFEYQRLLYDPFITSSEAHNLGARKVELDELLAASDIVTLHAPLLPETRHLLGAPEFRAMRDGTTFINTARGAIIDQRALELELVSGRLNAVIDTTDPEPLAEDSPLFELDNVIVTPHIAGSLGNEISRMGDLIEDELRRFAAGRPLQYELSQAQLAVTA